MPKALNLIGEKFGKLKVIEKMQNNKHGKTVWNCICECGVIKSYAGSDLKSGKTKSCGCINRIHGLSDTRLYNIWHVMKHRCHGKEQKISKHYKLKGIKVCEEWRENFLNFYEWSKNNGYEENLEIDRINPLEGYRPDNCRWVNSYQQVWNIKRSETQGIKKRPNGKFEVGITSKKKYYYLGVYETLEEAKEVRLKAEQKYWSNDMV